eukprot:m.149865 g.149865  ORF g.149865 m.149865 type:complete len:74 (-) comp14210_c0_seq1:2004-2225(-)
MPWSPQRGILFVTCVVDSSVKPLHSSLLYWCNVRTIPGLIGFILLGITAAQAQGSPDRTQWAASDQTVSLLST